LGFGLGCFFVGVGVGVGLGFGVGDVLAEAEAEAEGEAEGDVVGEAVALVDGEADAVDEADPVTDGVGDGELVASAALGAAAIKAIPAAVAAMARNLLIRASFPGPLPAARSRGAAGGTAHRGRRRRAGGRW
jgi:hypothetical protein